MPLCMKGRSSDSVADQSMHFWGVCCESGKQYAQVVGQRFRITMAVLDPKSYSMEESEKTVSLIVIRGGIEYLLCVLKHEEIHQVNLNLIFDKGENVVFYINGHGKVYLSGYQLTDSESDVLNDENGYLCPLVEVKSPKSKAERKGKASKTPQNSGSESVTPKSKKKDVDKNDFFASDKSGKLNWGSFLNSDNGNNEVLDDSESDEDYSAGEGEAESESASESESDDEDSEWEEEDVELEEEEIEEDDDDDDDDEEEDEDEEEEETAAYSRGSQKKRKNTKTLQPQKRSRYDSFTSTSNAAEKSENVICLDDDSKDSSDCDAVKSTNNTPMPKKQDNLEKKKSKKKKRLSEISNLSMKSVKGLKTPVAESTPNKAENPVKKLQGGVEIQDVIIGKGPIATVGKMVHVFYIGRFHDKKIFDSRTPGKKPFSFKLGAQQVIKGWDVGVQGMRVGGKRKLKIPPNMGYGNSALEGIPPNSTLYFVVELQAVS